MTAVSVPEPLAHTPATDAARARELYKYFRPPTNHADADPEPPDTILTAHAQLVAWRFNAQRAMVSLIDRETQYFVAESTKTLQLDDALQHDDPADAIWAGCVNVPKAGRLCEHTIATLPPPGGGPACFEVCDLSQDARFNTLDFIAGPPHFRYYIGAPLRTRKGINIGSIFALDDKVRQGSTRSERHFLAVMAENVVQHLEMMKDKRDRQRSTTMNLCLSAFVDPDHQARKRRRHSSPPQSPSLSEKKPSVRTAGSRKSDGEMTSSPLDSDTNYGRRIEGNEHLETFSRAADLLREALDFEEGGGGVVFMDTAAVVDRRRPFRPSPNNGEVSSSQESDKEEHRWNHSPTRESVRVQTANSNNGMPVREPNTAHSRPAEILAHVHHPQQPSRPPRLKRQHFSALSPAELNALIKRHPRGKLFTFESSGILASSSSDEQQADPDTQNPPKPRKTTVTKAETVLLQECFPTARQIIFLPLWDSTTSRWSACFVYNCSEYRHFSNNPEFLYCIAFGNCIMTEIARLATLFADQHKSDFIGSISHELRSPLHGILASCEFLADTECDSFQRSLVDTADSCARTLLDTINMVLDYSKINTFEKNTNKVRRSRRDMSATTASLGLQSHLNIYSDVDLAAITEEVVEGVATGHMHRDRLTSVDMHDITETRSRGGTIRKSGPILPRKDDVEIVVNIPMRDWTFWSQAGALRRIVMNLFGNSLKYTKYGFVSVELEAQDVEPTSTSNVCAMVTLTVTDSGQGISPEYMRTKLFTPFAQESTLTPGTGLGLSLVKSIVDMLGGTIEIESTLGVGTKVNVRLPMTKGTLAHSKNGSASTPTSSGSLIERVKDDSINFIKSEAKYRTVIIYQSKTNDDMADQMESSTLMRKSITTYLHGWYGFQTQQWNHVSTPEAMPDIIIVEETDLQELTQAAPQLLNPDCPTNFLVLCNTASAQTTRKAFASCNNVEEIRYPFGPYKLARALRICLERLQTGKQQEQSTANVAAIPRVGSIAEHPSSSPMDDVVNAVENITLSSTTDSVTTSIAVVRTGDVSALEDSVNAQMAMNHTGSFQLSESSKNSDNKVEFPFPESAPADPLADGTISPTAREQLLSSRPLLPPTRRTISATRQDINIHDVVETNAMSSRGALTNAPTASSKPSPRSPRMLLVDDNRINLKLLQTFMKKRKYTTVTNAEDGQEAVNAYSSLLRKSPPEPPDIILMDISMPVMNGFEATRRIREIEAQYREQLPPMHTPPSCLIIALTGLASGRDQSEAFTSGFDLYITKPVSFAEISRLLDNWEANGGAAMADGVPHGAVVAGEGGGEGEGGE